MQRYNGIAIANYTTSGVTSARIVATPTITVYESGTVTLASIYDDNGITVKANPFTGQANGRFFFYAADGVYDIVVSGGTPSLPANYQISAEQLDDTLSLVSMSGGFLTSINGLTAAAQTITVSTSGATLAVSSSGDTHTINVPIASGSRTGMLSSSDWTSFNSRISSLNGLTEDVQTLAIGSAGNSPNWASASGQHALNIPFASASKSGIISSGDWTSFSNKQSSLSGGTSSQYLRGDMTFAALTTSAVPEGSNQYYTDARARAAISATSPLSYSSATGIMSVQAADTSHSGYLTSADWNSFNGKVGSVAVGSTGTDFAVSQVGDAVTLNLPAASSTASGKVNTTTQSFSGGKTFNSIWVTQAGRRRYVRNHAAPSTVTVAQTLDDVIAINKSTAGATTVTLPASPTLGDEITICDDKGDAAANNITISGNGKNIIGSANLVLSTNYAWATLVYNGTQWNRISG